MCVCLANGKVSYLCRVALATYILKGRFSDGSTVRRILVKFKNRSAMFGKASCPYGRGLHFPYLPI